MRSFLAYAGVFTLLWYADYPSAEAAPPVVTYQVVTDVGVSNGVREFVYEYAIDVPQGCEVYWVRGGWIQPGGASSGYSTNTHNATGPTQITGSFNHFAPDSSGQWTFWLQVRYYMPQIGDDILYGDDLFVTVP